MCGREKGGCARNEKRDEGSRKRGVRKDIQETEEGGLEGERCEGGK